MFLEVINFIKKNNNHINSYKGNGRMHYFNDSYKANFNGGMRLLTFPIRLCNL